MIAQNSTLAQVIHDHPSIAFVLHRFEIPLDNPEKSLELICDEHDINAEFFIELLKVYINPEYFRAEKFKEFEVPVIVDYLKKTHKFFLNKRLPEIEQVLGNLVHHYEEESHFLTFVKNFYADYRINLIQHIDEEEKYLFPLSIQLDEMQRNPNVKCIYYSLKKFTDIHTDHLETSLREVRDAASIYSKELHDLTLYRVLLTHLNSFEEDLHIHHLIEDDVLVPKVMKIEKELRATTRIS